MWEVVWIQPTIAKMRSNTYLWMTFVSWGMFDLRVVDVVKYRNEIKSNTIKILLMTLKRNEWEVGLDSAYDL